MEIIDLTMETVDKDEEIIEPKTLDKEMMEIIGDEEKLENMVEDNDMMQKSILHEEKITTIIENENRVSEDDEIIECCEKRIAPSEECHKHPGAIEEDGGLVTVQGTIINIFDSIYIYIRCTYVKNTKESCNKQRKIKLHCQTDPGVRTGLLCNGRMYLFMNLEIVKGAYLSYESCHRTRISEYEEDPTCIIPYAVALPFKWIKALPNHQDSQAGPLFDVKEEQDREDVRQGSEEPEEEEEDPTSIERPLKKRKTIIKEEKWRKFTLIQSLALVAIIGEGAGSSCRGCDLRYPFKKEGTRKKVRRLLRDRKYGRLLSQDDAKLVDDLYQLGDFHEQLAEFGQDAKRKLVQLMLAYLPLVVGGGQLEAYVLPPGTYKGFGANLAIDIGLRLPVNASPLQPGMISSVYGNLHFLDKTTENSMERWKLFSTIKQGRNSTYLMLGPIQLVNHSFYKPNAQYVKEGRNVVLNITRTVQPGEQILTNYGIEYESERKSIELGVCPY